jgi:hypothetical protein
VFKWRNRLDKRQFYETEYSLNLIVIYMEGYIFSFFGKSDRFIETYQTCESAPDLYLSESVKH